MTIDAQPAARNSTLMGLSTYWTPARNQSGDTTTSCIPLRFAQQLFVKCGGSVAQFGLKACFPFPRTDLSFGLCYKRAECGEAVEDGNPDLELGDLTVELARGEALAQELGAVHLGLSAASAVIPAPSSPDGPAEPLRGPQDLVAGHGPSGVGLPWFGVLARWDDAIGTAEIVRAT
jgi:hypothetical protein